jgi:hypothetical protein
MNSQPNLFYFKCVFPFVLSGYSAGRITSCMGGWLGPGASLGSFGSSEKNVFPAEIEARLFSLYPSHYADLSRIYIYIYIYIYMG